MPRKALPRSKTILYIYGLWSRRLFRGRDGGVGLAFKIQSSLHQDERLDILVRHLIADRKLMTAFGATARKNGTAILGGHAGAKPMLVHSFTVSGLVRSFHDLESIFLNEVYNLVFIPLKFQGLDSF